MNGVSGNLIFNSKKISLKELGREEYKKIVSNMKKENRDEFNSIMLSSRMYPMEMFEDFLQNLVKSQGEDKLKEFVQLSTKAQFRYFFGLSRIMPHKIMEKMVRMMWPRQINIGELESVVVQKHKVVLTSKYYSVTDFFLKCTLWWLEELFSILLQRNLKGKAKVKGIITEFTFS